MSVHTGSTHLYTCTYMYIGVSMYMNASCSIAFILGHPGAQDYEGGPRVLRVL